MTRRPPGIQALRFALAIALVLSSLAGCASNGKAPEKKKRTILMTEYDDTRVGQEASADVAAQMGVLDDPELNAYVTEIGRKLLRGLPLRSFQYHFAVVDQTEPNAFALPGGYVFISRGLLALAGNEDELACVIGHEITHVAHRHAAAQQDLASRGIAMPWIRAGRLASYSRDMERDADKGGQILCAAAGYDPLAMSTFLGRLGQSERLRIGHSRNPSFLDTHPGSTERVSANAVQASEIRWQRDPLLGDTEQSLLAKIDGLPLGDRPEAGVFHGELFLHPDLDFQMRFPHGWYTANNAAAVGAAEPRGRAIVFLQADQPPGEPRQIAEAWVKKTQESQPLDVRDSRPVKIGDLDAWRMSVDSSMSGGQISSLVTFFPYRGGTWRITGMSRASQAEEFLGRTLQTTRSFRPLDEEQRRSIVQIRLAVVQARTGEGLQDLTERTGSAWSVPEIAVFNGVFVDHRFRGGEPVKIARAQAYGDAKESAKP